MLILFEISEISLYTINSKLTSLNNLDIELIPILGSATDQKLIEKIFKEKNVNMVFHASAYKPLDWPMNLFLSLGKLSLNPDHLEVPVIYSKTQIYLKLYSHYKRLVQVVFLLRNIMLRIG